MTNLAISYDDGDTIVSLGDRMLGYIHPTSYFGPQCIAMTDGGDNIIALPVPNIAAGIELFEALTHLPAGAECPCGDVNARQATFMAWVPDGRAEAVLVLATPERDDHLDVSMQVALSPAELRQLIEVLSFAAARLAVTS